MTAAVLRQGAVLSIDLDAVVSNWRLLAGMAAPAECSAVVKADAYGLGAAQVGRALLAAGCRTFFVAHLQEGIDLRQAIGSDGRIFVLNGTPSGTEREVLASGLIPVVNTVGELAAWRAHASATAQAVAVALQLDSGMARLGVPPGDVAMLAAEPDLLAGISIELVMSHLACADEANHPANQAQQREFAKLRAVLPAGIPASLANSSGIFLGAPFHLDLVRPGAALYGVNPVPGRANPMRQVVSIAARVLQLRDAPTGSYIGYGHVHRVRRRSLLATLSIGYADGWPRSASMAAFFRGETLPFAGRVSMDTIIVDATDCSIPPGEGDFVDLTSSTQTVDDIAAASGTIGYEILTRLGRRFRRDFRKPSVLPA